MSSKDDLISSLWNPPSEPEVVATSVDTAEVLQPVSRLAPMPKTLFSNHQVGGQLISWVDGVPVPVTGEAISKQNVQHLISVAASLPYEGEMDAEGNFLPIPIEFFRDDGSPMTNIEVSLVKLARRAAAGNELATTMILDRILGKPKQATENVNMSMTIGEYLKHMEAGGNRGG